MILKKTFFRIQWMFTIILFLCAVLGVHGNDQSYQIHIQEIDRSLHKNMIGVPSNVDLAISWELYHLQEDKWELVESSMIERYRVLCIIQNQVDDSAEVQGNYYEFTAKNIGQPYRFLVEGFIHQEQVAVSDTAYLLTGKIRANQESNHSSWWNYIPFNGRIPLWLIRNEQFFDGATKAGKMAFHVIWNFFIIGVIIWIGFCVRNLSLEHIFPMEKGIVLGRGYDEILKRKSSKEFNGILEDWRDIITRANKNVRMELSQDNRVTIAEIEGVNAKFWQAHGSEAVHELLKRIENSALDKYPTVRIIKAGLENHELGGFHWLEVSKEVDRAIENRASSEKERIRRKSFLDWLWNLGTLSPLIGLFGTATGISHAFAQLTYLRSDVTQTELVKRLAGGIYEALWTTIEGLAIGVFLMILYFYYQNKMNWIYSKWEEIYVYVAEKL